MRIMSVVAGAALLAVGGVWVFQGIGTLKGSFMTGSPFWAVAGAVCIVAGAVMIFLEIRRR